MFSLEEEEEEEGGWGVGGLFDPVSVVAVVEAERQRPGGKRD